MEVEEAEEEEQEDDEIVEVGIHQKMLGVLRCCKIPHQDSCSYRNSKVNQGPHGGWSEEIQAGVLEERTSVNM